MLNESIKLVQSTARSHYTKTIFKQNVQLNQDSQMHIHMRMGLCLATLYSKELLQLIEHEVIPSGLVCYPDLIFLNRIITTH